MIFHLHFLTEKFLLDNILAEILRYSKLVLPENGDFYVQKDVYLESV